MAAAEDNKISAGESLASILWSKDGWTGQRIGRYKIENILGDGGMGRVFLARDVVLQREVALKTISESFQEARESGQLEQFLREAQAVATLVHPNVVRVYDVVHREGVVAVAMEYVKGGTLQDLLRQENMLPVYEICRLIAEAADGLYCAHENGLIHRDIKPANLMLSEKQQCKVVDFGATHVVEKKELSMLEGKIIGTPHYISPEVILGKAPLPASDIYSLGIVLWRSLAGTTPFSAKTRKELYLKHVKKKPPDIREYRKDVPPPLAAVLDTCLQKNPSRRFNDCRELAGKLKDIARRIEEASHSDIAKISAAISDTSISRRRSPSASTTTQSKITSLQETRTSARIPLIAGIADFARRRTKAAVGVAAGIVLVPILVIALIVVFGGNGDADKPDSVNAARVRSTGAYRTGPVYDDTGPAGNDAGDDTGLPTTAEDTVFSHILGGGSAQRIGPVFSGFSYSAMADGATTDYLDDPTKPRPPSSRPKDADRFAWPPAGEDGETTAWIEAAFPERRKVSAANLFWFIQPGTACTAPERWRLFYEKDDGWKEVTLADGATYTAPADDYARLTFEEVETTALKIEARLEKGEAAGLLRLHTNAEIVQSGLFGDDAVFDQFNASRKKRGSVFWSLKNSKHPRLSGGKYFSWEPATGSAEWIERIFTEPRTVSATSVFWFDNHERPRGKCAVPDSWTLQFRKDNRWNDVALESGAEYGTSPDGYNVVRFKEVRAGGLRIVAELKPGYSSGLYRWLTKPVNLRLEKGKTEGFITDWLISGPYTGHNTLNTAFLPETNEAEAEWKPLSKGVKRFSIDLKHAVGGSNRAVYAKTYVHAPRSMKVKAELGSDDGMKAWVVETGVDKKTQPLKDVPPFHVFTGGRSLKVSEDTATTELAKGLNMVVMKIAQGGGDWGFSLRFTDMRGLPIEGLKVQTRDPTDTTWVDDAGRYALSFESETAEQDLGATLESSTRPRDSSGKDTKRFSWLPRTGTVEWIERRFAAPRDMAAVAVYWYDGSQTGAQVRPPETWKVLCADAKGTLKEVRLKPESSYATAVDRYHVVRFEPVTTGAVRLEVQSQKGYAAGLLRLVVNPTGYLTEEDAPFAASHKPAGDTFLYLEKKEPPLNSEDKTEGCFSWAGKKGSDEWIVREFASPRTITGTSVYWLKDDDRDHKCGLPRNWKIEYSVDGTSWKPVDLKPGAGYESGLALHTFNTVAFEPVEATYLRLSVETTFSAAAGLLRWRILPEEKTAADTSESMKKEDTTEKKEETAPPAEMDTAPADKDTAPAKPAADDDAEKMDRPEDYILD